MRLGISRNRLPGIPVPGKQEQPTWLSPEEAAEHRSRGIGIWDWAGTETDAAEPDVVLGCAGDVPTLEAIAAAQLLRLELPDLKVRVVNVLDLMRLQSSDQHPHGLEDDAFDAPFTVDKPVV